MFETSSLKYLFSFEGMMYTASLILQGAASDKSIAMIDNHRGSTFAIYDGRGLVGGARCDVILIKAPAKNVSSVWGSQ